MTAPRPVFLHTGWRSRGTWIWAGFRALDEVRAYYEPLHEYLATIRGADIGRFAPNSWPSGHGVTEAYFAEYAPLLRRSGTGVAGYEPRFAFDRFFMAPHESDPALEAYLRHLLAAAEAEGRCAVLKFCRSLGRVGWFAQHFPDALHLTVLRNPWTQWLSARHQFIAHRNAYFLLAPFLIMARNADRPEIAEAVRALSVPMAPRLGRALGLDHDAAERHVRRLAWPDRFRGFLAFWAATAMAAARAGATIVDAGAMARDAAYREGIGAEIRRGSRLPLVLPAQRITPGPRTEPTPLEAEICQLASDLVREALASLAAPPLMPGLLPPRPGPPARRVARNGALLAGLRTADAAAYTAAKRLTYPLRRLRGALHRRRARALT